jgi:uncharacterized Zn finger protein
MIYEVNCALCGNVFYKILFDDDGKYEVSCPNCGATYPHLTFKTVRPNEVSNVNAPYNTSLKNKVKEIIAGGKISFCPVHLIPTTTKCPICGRVNVVKIDHVPDDFLNLIVDTVTNDTDSEEDAVTAILEVILRTLTPQEGQA